MHKGDGTAKQAVKQNDIAEYSGGLFGNWGKTQKVEDYSGTGMPGVTSGTKFCTKVTRHFHKILTGKQLREQDVTFEDNKLHKGDGEGQVSGATEIRK